MPISVAAGVYEIVLLLAGVFVLWRVALQPAVRRNPPPALLARWDATPGEFLLFLWLICTGALVVSFSVSALLPKPISADMAAMLGTGAFELGALAGIAIFRIAFDRHKTPPPPTTAAKTLLSGVATFLAVLPIVVVVARAWEFLLDTCHIPYERQPVVEMLSKADSPGLLVATVSLACIGAPLMEELVFRAGIFRYARTRLPRWAALFVPALIFAAIHTNLASFVPLIALGIVFSLAYERTGNIKTTMIAHGLFNLNSIVLVFAGVSK